MATLKPREAAAALGVPVTTITGWFDRGLCPAFSKYAPGQHRRFAWRDLVHAALIKEIAGLGAPLEAAARIARLAIAGLGNDDIRRDDVKVYFWPTDCGWAGGYVEPMNAGAHGCVRLGSVVRRLHERLGERMPPPSGQRYVPAFALAELAERDLKPNDKAQVSLLRDAARQMGGRLCTEDAARLAEIAARYGYAV